MHDPERVRLGDRLAGLHDELDGLFDGERSAGAQPGGEVASVEMLHHEVRRPVVAAGDVEHAGHVLTLDLDGRARLAFEASQRLGVAAPLR